MNVSPSATGQFRDVGQVLGEICDQLRGMPLERLTVVFPKAKVHADIGEFLYPVKWK